MLPEIKYELHDSVIASISAGPRREVKLIIDLYPIYYPEITQITLRFGGIVNIETVNEYVSELHAEADEDYIGCRIDCFQYDTTKESKPNNLWFYFITDWLGALRIHCSQMSMKLVDFEPDQNSKTE